MVNRLNENLPKSVVLTHPHTGMSYITGAYAISAANAVFGEPNWSYEITDMDIGDKAVIARVKLTALIEGQTVVREDVGVGVLAIKRGTAEATGQNLDLGVKSAVTDGLKRCLRTFGRAFGLKLYAMDSGLYDETHEPDERWVVDNSREADNSRGWELNR